MLFLGKGDPFLAQSDVASICFTSPYQHFFPEQKLQLLQILACNRRAASYFHQPQFEEGKKRQWAVGRTCTFWLNQGYG